MNFMQHRLIIFALLFILPAIPKMQAQPEDVSLIQLIATPEKYHGKFVRVKGYLHNQFEDSAIYFTKDDADHLIGENALWVSYSEKVQKQTLDPKQKVDNLRYFDSKYVLIEGYFDKDGHGHLGAFAGTIGRATRIMELIRWFDGGKPLRKV